MPNNQLPSHRELASCTCKYSEDLATMYKRNETLEKQIKLLQEENKVILSHYHVYD